MNIYALEYPNPSSVSSPLLGFLSSAQSTVLGVSDMAHQWTAIAAGSVFALIGGVTCRLTNSRVRAASRWADIAILAWLLFTLMLGLSTIPVSIEHANHGDAQVMILLAEWAQSIAYLRPALSVLGNSL